jgi:ribosomal protein L11 methyltransferase
MSDSAAPSTALTVVITAPTEESELAADVLWQLGAAAVEEVADPSGSVSLRAALGEDRVRLVAALEGVRWSWRFEDVDLAVADTWRQHVGVIDVDDSLRVVPAWLTDSTESFDGLTLSIEPGPTFGLGTHATTRLCLRALRGVIRPGDTVLDAGTGTGVLAIAAVRFGGRSAHGVDINPASLEVVRANAVLNGVADAVTVSVDPLEVITEPFDIVVANILAPVLRELAPDLTRLARRRIVLSGLLVERYAEVLDAMRPWRETGLLVEDGWAAVTLER